MRGLAKNSAQTVFYVENNLHTYYNEDRWAAVIVWRLSLHYEKHEEEEMLIYLMRHGETDWNKEKRLQGQSDIPLNEYGVDLAVKTAEALAEVSFDMAFCSPLGRAEETARIILGTRKTPLYPDARLKEINFGTHEGVCFDTAKQDPKDPLHNFFCEPDRYVPPEGAESFAQVMERGRSFLQEKVVPLEGVCESVLVVAHGAFNRSLLSLVMGMPLKDFWRIALPNCAVSILSLEEGRLKGGGGRKGYYGGAGNRRP